AGAGLPTGFAGMAGRATALACGCLGAATAALTGLRVTSAWALLGLAAALALGAGLAAGFFAFMRFLYRVSGGGRPHLLEPDLRFHADVRNPAQRPTAAH